MPLVVSEMQFKMAVSQSLVNPSQNGYRQEHKGYWGFE